MLQLLDRESWKCLLVRHNWVGSRAKETKRILTFSTKVKKLILKITLWGIKAIDSFSILRLKSLMKPSKKA